MNYRCSLQSRKHGYFCIKYILLGQEKHLHSHSDFKQSALPRDRYLIKPTYGKEIPPYYFDKEQRMVLSSRGKYERVKP